MRTYGRKIRETIKSETRISWQGERIYVDKISFTMGDIRVVVHGLYETVRERLVKDLLLVEDGGKAALPMLDLGRLFDNAVEMSEY